MDIIKGSKQEIEALLIKIEAELSERVNYQDVSKGKRTESEVVKITYCKPFEVEEGWAIKVPKECLQLEGIIDGYEKTSYTAEWVE